MKICLAFLACTLVLICRPVAAITVYEAAVANSTIVSNGVREDLGGDNAITELGGTITQTNTHGLNNMSGFGSTGTIDALLTASPTSRDLLDTDTVTMTAVVSSIDSIELEEVITGAGDLRSNGFEFGLAPSLSFRPSPHLLFQVDADDDLFGLAHFPGAGTPATSFYADAAGPNDAGWGATEESLRDGFTVELVADKDGFMFTVSDVEFTGDMTAPGVFSGEFTGTEFIDNFGSGHLYAASQKNGDPVIVNYTEVSIEVTAAGGDPNADFDGDLDIDGEDYLVWQRGGSPNSLSNGDLLLWQGEYGPGALTVSAFSSVPEPSCMVLLGIGMLAGWLRQR